LVDDLGWFETVAGGIGSGAYLARFYADAQLVIRKLMNFASFATKANTKVIIDCDCDDVKISECTVGQISLEKTAGTFAPRWVSIDKCYGESNYEIAAFNFDACKSVKLTSSTGNAGLVGVSINTNALGVNISKCTLLDNQQDGIQIQGGSYIQITDNDISSNNKGAGVSYSGIRFVANADHVDILRNRIKNHLSSNYTHAYGILTTGGGVISNLTVGENDIANYVTAAFTDNAGATSKNSRSWTPTVAGAAVTVNAATYSVAGELILVTLDLTWPATADATAVTIAGMAGIPEPRS
jgi:parallel beta-helix repeat protein